jgi:probable HAF family extracellular repeat protein
MTSMKKQSRYEIRDIVGAKSLASGCSAVNAKGHVTGVITDSNGVSSIFLWANDNRRLIYSLRKGEKRFFLGISLNDNDAIALNVARTSGPMGSIDKVDTYLLTPPAYKPLALRPKHLPPKPSYLEATVQYRFMSARLNNQNEVVGCWGLGIPSLNEGSDDYVPFLWRNGEFHSLDQFSPVGQATAINNGSQIVGKIYLPGARRKSLLRKYRHPKSPNLPGGAQNPHTQACLWERKPTGWAVQVLGTLGGARGGPNSEAACINERGQVVGFSEYELGSTSIAAFLWERGVMRNLGHLAEGHDGRPGLAHARCINNHGQVVGYSLPDRNDPRNKALRNVSVHDIPYHAVLWSEGEIHDLNHCIPEGTGWELMSMAAINDSGVIVGTGRFNGTERGFMLVPQRS